ncbi:MAG: radical SAM family heme chaperone HemW, partial [Pseudomonadota bacterium]|nr:radical SAM family heme chaperone HemW [Pseudomonadota bacterium]
MTMPAPRLALYVHWPFCQAKCPYCDFNSHVTAEIDYARFAGAYHRELEHMAQAYGAGRRLDSIFFGGGTPSLMPAWLVEAIISDADQLFGLAPDIEITAEANPTSAEAETFAGFRAAGVNRLSLGVQSLRDETLAFLGREHSAREALAALRTARQTFDRLSIDLIYARQDQQLADWTRELQMALDLGLDHMSLYQLTIEPGTGFHSRARRGDILTADDSLAADMYAETNRLMRAAGLPAYEISNHARPGS